MNYPEALKLACETSKKNMVEETGGIILHRAKDDDYQWVPLHNLHSGTSTARVLFAPTPEEYAEKVAMRFEDGYRTFASFHTHPTFSSSPSSIDTGTLFPNFEANFIYSLRDDELVKYLWTADCKRLIRYIHTFEPKEELAYA